MALTTRVISWTLDDVSNATEVGTITIQPTVPEIVDTTDGIVYTQKTLTYSLSVGQSSALITTDNTGTNPASGSWGYNIMVQLEPGVPGISVQDVLVPAGGGSYTLAAILNSAGL